MKQVYAGEMKGSHAVRDTFLRYWWSYISVYSGGTSGCDSRYSYSVVERKSEVQGSRQRDSEDHFAIESLDGGCHSFRRVGKFSLVAVKADLLPESRFWKGERRRGRCSPRDTARNGEL